MIEVLEKEILNKKCFVLNKIVFQHLLAVVNGPVITLINSRVYETAAKSGTKSACAAVEALRTSPKDVLGISLVGQKIDYSSYRLIVTLLSYLVGV
jgi:hypothetical protein